MSTPAKSSTVSPRYSHPPYFLSSSISPTHNIFFFFLNYTPPPEISPFPLPAALPIPGRLTRLRPPPAARRAPRGAAPAGGTPRGARALEVHRADAAQSPVLQDRADAWQPRLPLHLQDRKSTRLNSSHSQISYAVFCLK